uniref:G-protein coupled receptors family 1 profile domain-containing protein n=1 Tax=Globodera rostochiensis TaxID=31243 RepID=A0A914I253_GLORO
MSLQNYSMANLAFDRFGYGIFSLELVLSTLFRWLISLPGLVFNAALLYTIKRDKNLRGTCAILLAIGAVCDFCFLLAFSVPFAVALSGRNVISNFDCYFVQFLPVFGLYSSVWIVLFVGFDRLFCVLFPLRYTLFEKKLFIYMTPMLTITFGYSTVVVMAASHWTLFIYPDWPVICTHNDMFSFGMSSTLLRNGLVINGISFSCYVLVGLALIRCWRKNPSSMAKHRIFKSLAAIMTLVVGSYFAICAVRLLTVSVTDPFFLLHISPSISALLTCTAASSNAPLLFAFSSEYRLAFRKHLKKWPLIKKCLISTARSQIALTANSNALPSAHRIVQAMNPSQPLNKKDGGKSHRKSPRLLEMAAAAAARGDKKKPQHKLSPVNKHRGNGEESISSSSSTKRDALLAMDRPQNELRPIDWADRSERHDSLLSLAEACAEFGLLLQSKESNSGKQNKSLDECATNIGRTSNAHNQNIGNVDEAITAQRAQSDDPSPQSPSKKRKRPKMVETSKNAKEKSHELANGSTHSKNNSRETADEQQNDRIPEQITDSELQLQQPHSSEPSKAQSAQKSIGSEAPSDQINWI